MSHCKVNQEVYGLSKGNCCFDPDAKSGTKNCNSEEIKEKVK